MGIIKRLKYSFAMWIWKDNAWTVAIDQIKDTVKKLRNNEIDVMRLKWTFKFLKTPPSNKFICDIRLNKREKTDE